MDGLDTASLLWQGGFFMLAIDPVQPDKVNSLYLQPFGGVAQVVRASDS